jgi:hypothetical protein
VLTIIEEILAKLSMPSKNPSRAVDAERAVTPGGFLR